jgi:hypothetical protein
LESSAVLSRQRWDTPDGDFIDVDRTVQSPSNSMAPLLVLFHGLEGSSSSHYALAFARVAASMGMAFAVPHFRGCSGEINRAPRAYHSGDHAEVDWILRRLKAENSHRPLFAVGVSLGGNALTHWAGVRGTDASQVVEAMAAICAPLDLTAAGHAIGRGFNRWVYTRMFLQSMRPKAMAKLAQYPGLFSAKALAQAKTLHDFDNLFTAPLHGFLNTEDYWLRASAKPVLSEVRIPALLVNALNDPFVPAVSLPGKNDVSRSVTLWQPRHGGHVGFPSTAGAKGGAGDWLMSLPESVGQWLLAHASAAGLAHLTRKRDG